MGTFFSWQNSEGNGILEAQNLLRFLHLRQKSQSQSQKNRDTWCTQILTVLTLALGRQGCKLRGPNLTFVFSNFSGTFPATPSKIPRIPLCVKSQYLSCEKSSKFAGKPCNPQKERFSPTRLPPNNYTIGNAVVIALWDILSMQVLQLPYFSWGSCQYAFAALNIWGIVYLMQLQLWSFLELLLQLLQTDITDLRIVNTVAVTDLKCWSNTNHYSQHLYFSVINEWNL